MLRYGTIHFFNTFSHLCNITEIRHLEVSLIIKTQDCDETTMERYSYIDHKSNLKVSAVKRKKTASESDEGFGTYKASK